MPSQDPWDASLQSSTVVAGGKAAKRSAERVPALTLLAHPDVRRIGEVVRLRALAAGREVEISRLEPAFLAPVSPTNPGASDTPRPLADPHLSRRPLRLVPTRNSGIRLVRGEVSGPIEVDGVLLDTAIELHQEDLSRGIVVLLAERIALLLHLALALPPPTRASFGIGGASDAVAELLAEIHRAAPLDVPVLLRGETGTGKELAARALHAAGRRPQAPCVTVNMAAIPANLAAAELFGAERGAFTGSDRRRPGYFRQADGGTLFLDEVGSTPLEIQDLLLRALESGEIQPVGAATAEHVDVRVVAATDSDLDAAIRTGSFRAPLLHRLSGWDLHLPPLRTRRDDIARLLIDFLRRELHTVGAGHRLDDPGPRGQPWLLATIVAHLVRHDWPGNVRQLKNIARRLVASSYDRHEIADAVPLEHWLSAGGSHAPAGETLTGEASTGEASTRRTSTSNASAPTPTEAAKPAPRRRPAAQIDDATLVETLRRHRWRLRPAAVDLGISRPALYRLVDRCPAVRRASDLHPDELTACLENCGGDLDIAAERLEVSRHALLLRLRELGLDPTGLQSPV